MINFWHRWMNPHCPECAQENHCDGCDVLTKLLEQERYDKNRILEQLIELTKPVQIKEERKTIEDKLPLNANMVWKKRRQMLEEEDRNRARVMAEQKLNQIKPLTTEELEEQLGVKEENAPRTTEEIS